MHFVSPVWLLLLVGVAAALIVYVVLQLRRTKYAARFSNVSLLASVAPRRPGWRRHLTFALLLIGLAVLSVGVAQPTASVRVPRDRATVILALDVSLSMQATDVLPSRISAAKTAADNFIDLLPPRINLGLVKFGGSASVVVPPTIDRESAKAGVNGLQLQDSTAIGEAVFTSLDAISVFSKTTTAANDAPAPARIVLMSDGANNKGRSVSSAAAAASAAKIPVSTIAFGTDTGTVTVPGEGGPQPVPANKPTLQMLAQDTGGSFHTAASAQELESVFKDIGSQVGYTTANKIVSWRFMIIGLLFTLAAAGLSLMWGGRLV
jgi:Ca-activated chloride channel family protein